MKCLFTLLFLLSVTFAHAQTVRLIRLNELESRIAGGKDTFYIINYWATWCAPCVKELPYFDKFQKNHLQQPVKVLLVSLDFLSQYEKAVIPFVKKNKWISEVFLLNERNQQEYIDRISKQWSGALPATAFINRKRNTSHFFEREFTYEFLLKTFNSLQ